MTFVLLNTLRQRGGNLYKTNKFDIKVWKWQRTSHLGCCAVLVWKDSKSKIKSEGLYIACGKNPKYCSA